MNSKISNKDLVSVIIPSYNRADLLAECVRSVMAQTYRPVECIIVDDGSSDNTKSVIDELSKSIDNLFTLTYMHQNNAGAQVARNNGTAASNGAFIQYLDSDDLLYKNKLKTQVEYLNNHNDCDGVFGDWNVGTPGNYETVIAYRNKDMIAQMLTSRCIHTLSFLMRRSIVQKIGEWDINIKRNQEIDFHLRGVLAGANFEYHSLLCGLWRTHSGDRIINKTNLFSAIQFYNKWEKKLLEKKLLTNDIKTGIANNYIWFLGEYPESAYKELAAVLNEIYRLNPGHAIFKSFKFRLLRSITGFNTAAKIFLYRYKQIQVKKLRVSFLF